MRDLFIGALGSILGSIATFFALRFYTGGKYFGGLYKLVRLIRDCSTAGVINVFPSRKTYLQHKDHGTAAEYIRKCDHSLYYVGYWLASSISFGQILKSFKALLERQTSVTVVFIDPDNHEILETCSKYLGTTPGELRGRIQYSIEQVTKLKASLKAEDQKYLTIKLHNVPLSASAFVIQQTDPRETRVLMDHKLYSLCRDESYGLELKDESKEITQKAMQSYLEICREAADYKSADTSQHA